MNVCLLNHICCGSTWFISSVYSGRVYICIITYVYVMIVCQCKIKRYGLAFILLFFFFSGSACNGCSLFQRRNESGGCWSCCSYFHQTCHCHQGNRLFLPALFLLPRFFFFFLFTGCCRCFFTHNDKLTMLGMRNNHTQFLFHVAEHLFFHIRSSTVAIQKFC